MEEFVMGGVATCCACFFTNPLEVVKTRMQLQGELQSRGTYTKNYRNVFHAFYTIGRHDGMKALQKGLVPGLYYQFCMNSVRLGSYQLMVNLGWTKNSDGSVNFIRSVGAGAISGVCGAFVGSPMYMVKVHLQAQASKQIAVGYQHQHSGFFQAFRHIFGEFGVLGLWRGVSAAMLRVMVGSAAQLTSFSMAKEFIANTKLFSKKNPNNILIPITASMLSGCVTVAFMTPFDVISTRMYNQGLSKSGRGLYYSSVPDCIKKLYGQEGLVGFYKGVSASFFRLWPHTVLSLVFWDQIRYIYKTAINK